jgi:gliding motility-associated-like protein
MKTLELICLQAKQGSRCMLTIFLCIYLSLLNIPVLSAQDIQLLNPSLEGKAMGSSVPQPWLKFEQSPDTQPEGCCGISQPASDGKTYVGMMGASGWTERIVQKLSTPLKAGKTYTVSFDLAYPPSYFSSKICLGSLVLYGAAGLGDKGDELWRSVTFMHTAWERYTAVFTPRKDYDYFVAGPFHDTTCTNAYTAVLLDNFSAYIREVPQIIVEVRNTCKGSNTGSAVVSVKAGMPPYRYLWEPGNYNDSTISNLKTGLYKVTVTSANGTSAVTNVKIGENELAATITSSSPVCHGDKNGIIQMSVSGGVAPYAFSIDSGATFQTSSQFRYLEAGVYSFEVRDVYDCSVSVHRFHLEQPELLTLESVKKSPVSCSSVKDGKLMFNVSGGSRPYTYAIPGLLSQRDSVIKQLDAGNYKYLITDNHNCEITGEAEINKEWRDCAVILPNAFSPNGDGVNDIFRAKVYDAVTDFRMAVYGRWGQLVFETNNPEMGWDGTQRGNQLPTGSYLWIVTYTDSKQQAIRQQGTLLLVR